VALVVVPPPLLRKRIDVTWVQMMQWVWWELRLHIREGPSCQRNSAQSVSRDIPIPKPIFNSTYHYPPLCLFCFLRSLWRRSDYIREGDGAFPQNGQTGTHYPHQHCPRNNVRLCGEMQSGRCRLPGFHGRPFGHALCQIGSKYTRERRGADETGWPELFWKNLLER